MTLAYYRPQSKRTSAFQKSYPLLNRVIGGEMTSMLKNAPSQLADGVGARMRGSQNQFSITRAASINRRGIKKQFSVTGSKPAARQKSKFLSVRSDQMVTNKRIILGVATRRFVATPAILVLLAAGLVCWPSSSLAQPIYAYQVPSTAPFGALDQDDMQILLSPALADQACGPVAAVNSLVFLQNLYPQIYDNNLVGDDPSDWMDAATKLVNYMNTTAENGTADTDFLNGIMNFINFQVPGMTYDHFVIASPGHTPTWQFLYNYLTQNQAVQILISPPDPDSPDSLGHYFSVKSITWNDGEGEKDGTIGVIDPATGLASNLDVALDPNSGALYVDYKGQSLPIVAEYEESPVPEPSTLALLGTGVIGLLLYVWGKRRQAA